MAFVGAEKFGEIYNFSLYYIEPQTKKSSNKL